AFLARRGMSPSAPRRVGHVLREVPVGYLEARAGDPSRFVDPAVREDWLRVHRVVSGPLWTWERWGDLAWFAWPRRVPAQARADRLDLSALHVDGVPGTRFGAPWDQAPFPPGHPPTGEPFYAGVTLDLPRTAAAM